ncbi:MAG: transcription elongation factor GreA [Bacillales bacterium]
MEKELLLTKEGYENLKKEYSRLIHEERPKVIEALQNARAMGDLSENADYDAARNKQSEIESRIKEIERNLQIAKEITETKSKGKNKEKNINIGSTVTLKDRSTGAILKVIIVSSIEADPLSDSGVLKISNECALGEALFNRKAGEIVRVNVAEPYDVEIIEFK